MHCNPNTRRAVAAIVMQVRQGSRSRCIANVATRRYKLASSSFTITPSLYKRLRYVPLRDFQGITQIATMPNVLVIHPSAQAKNMKELVAPAKTRPGKLSYGSGGVGSGNHPARELFKSVAKIDLVHVPYKGASIALTHILSREIDVVTHKTPAEYAAYLKKETEKWARVIREAKMRVE
jgi:tripartite-type tricarboxylate transporter receptor subunit TctC